MTAHARQVPAAAAEFPHPASPGTAGGHVAPVDLTPQRRPVSRALDVVVAAVCLVLLAPVMAAIAVLVRCTSPGPALYRQVRLGQGGRPFVMLKFRSMRTDADDRLHRDYVRWLLTDPSAATAAPQAVYKLDDDPRITRVGRWLRSTSLDELPQLVNVLRGEMALVGPRPVLPWEAPLFDPRHLARFRVRPGITGLWQTSGRSRLTMIQALDLDVEYAERASFRLDLRILLRTVPALLDRGAAR